MTKAKNTKRTKVFKKLKTKTIKKIAKEVVDERAEKKEYVGGFSVTVAGNNSGSTLKTPDDSIIRLDPNPSNLNILQGVTQSTRVGNKIRLTNGNLTLGIWPRSDASGNTNNLQMIRLLILYDKRNPTDTPTPFDNADFFQQSSATGYVGFSGVMYDLINRINKDRYAILMDRTYKLGFSTLVGSADGDPTFAYQSNNDFKAFHKINVNLNNKALKVLTYTDNNNAPNWRGCWLFAFGVAGAGPGNGADVAVANMYGQIVWQYNDL